MNEKTRWALALAFLAAVLAAIMKHLWGNGFVSEFHADFTDTILWAEASCESGKLASPDFHYAYFIPFGGNLLMNAFIPFFGVGLTTIRCAMTVAVVAMCGVVFAFFKSLGHGRAWAAASTAVVLGLLCSTIKMREVFFSHVIHYSLAVAFLLLALSVCGVAGEESEVRSMPRKALFLLTMLWTALCGKPMLLYAVVPVLGAVVVWRALEPAPLRQTMAQDASWVLAGAAGAGLGILVYSWLFAGIPRPSYPDVYEQYSSVFVWWSNLERLPRSWATLFYDPPAPGSVKIASGTGIRIAARILFAFALAVVPVLAWFRYGNFRKRERMLLIAHWILAGGVLFFWLFGKVSNYNWRISPLVVTSAAVAAVFVTDLWRNGCVQQRRFAAMSAFAALAFAAYLAFAMVRLRDKSDTWYGEGTLMPLLEETGASYGYCDDFWFSNSITVLSNGRIKLRQVKPRKDGGWEPHRYQSADHWYEPCPGRGKTVLVCRKSREHLAPKERMVSRYECRQYNFWYKRTDDFVVFVYDGDFPEKLL